MFFGSSVTIPRIIPECNKRPERWPKSSMRWGSTLASSDPKNKPTPIPSDLRAKKGYSRCWPRKTVGHFAKYQFGEIVTTDPHAYNALKNEYPALGIEYPVKHYTQYLAERLDELKPYLKHEIEAGVTFHDPCYLGRANGVYDEPRSLLGAIPGVQLVEMSHNRETSLCCGGGGGGMWLDGFQWEKAHVRLSEWRVQEALAVQADILAVACPYETPRFEDAAKTVPGADELVVKDIAELLVESMGEEV